MLASAGASMGHGCRRELVIHTFASWRNRHGLPWLRLRQGGFRGNIGRAGVKKFGPSAAPPRNLRDVVDTRVDPEFILRSWSLLDGHHGAQKKLSSTYADEKQ